MRSIEVKVEQNEAGQRIDSFISVACDTSRTFAANLIKDKHVLVNGKQVKKNHVVSENEIISVDIPPPPQMELVAQDIPLDIVYEDSSVIVVNKPKGMVVHPGAGNWDNTLVNALLHHCKGNLSAVGGEFRPGIVHRLDKDTSGLLVVAKNDTAHQKLAKQFENRETKREYHAVIYGRLMDGKGTIETPIGRSQQDRKKMAVNVKNAKSAITHYEVISEYQGFSYVKFKLGTGRTHQIRVHMASIGHPIAGDVVYGPGKAMKNLNGQCLHAKCIGFVHPESGEYLEFTCELPEYFTKLIDDLERKSGV